MAAAAVLAKGAASLRSGGMKAWDAGGDAGWGAMRDLLGSNVSLHCHATFSWGEAASLSATGAVRAGLRCEGVSSRESWDCGAWDGGDAHGEKSSV